MRSIATAAPVIVALALGACATSPTPPPREEPLPIGLHILRIAESLVGSPYRFGGTSPKGFDCSGLVQYSHFQLGIVVPRTAHEQRNAAVPVPRSSLLPGDLLFFAASGAQIDHVGVYAGNGRFVHAPGAGRRVAYASLDESWYAQRFAGAGRLWQSARATDVPMRAR